MSLISIYGGADQMTSGPSLVPMVLTREAGTERVMDIYSFLLTQGLIDITGAIDDETGKLVTAQFDYLDYIKCAFDRRLFINSPGGSVTAGLAIYDKIQRLKKTRTVATICSGIAASMGSILLVSGTPGQRGINKNGRVMIHQPLMSNVGTQKASELGILNAEIQKTYDTLAQIISEHTGMLFEQVKEDMKEDRWFTAQEARNYGPKGMVDVVLE
jgi:ATP-dependent Clp protease protease subunit